ncbi:hypothetical protein F511_42072 [Dorcoceras hygrometricum]|uniref:Uncharacterized protein n=1 Tax=Dorcoceras hygrometricum TaxID=472368 RepID=A0A2Z7AVJ0_9LAMI|nr:hypothetical protein F511_42072 [Dorcoceras hygrometricum]
MQHAIINAMKCMRAIKDRIARLVYRLANHLNQHLYPHGVSTEEIIDLTSDAITAIRRDPLALPSGPITRERSKRFKEALHGLVLSTQEMFKEEPAHEKLVGGLRDYIINIIQVQD